MQSKNTFFRDLVNSSLMNEWAENIDWILNDTKFNKWEKKEKTKYTKMVKNYLVSNNIDYKVLKIEELKNVNTDKLLYIYMNKSSSESLDLIRHIRNGIAHSHCDIKKNKNKELYLRITDYNKSGEITAELNVPISIITKLRLLYKKVIDE